jgi:hydroxyacylglutathione hydrolase
MRITFLGTGGAFCDYRVNYQNNAMVETSVGPVLLDCGTTACQSLKELGVHPADLAALVLTHLHGDHGSPEQLIWERTYDGPDGEPSWKTTPIYAPPNILDPLKRALDPYVGLFIDRLGVTRDDGVAELVDAHPCRIATIGDLHVIWFPVEHLVSSRFNKPAYGLWLERAGVRVWWSGDTTFHAARVTEAARSPGVKRLFHECTFSPAYKDTVHTHYSELQTLPADVRARITLMHHTQVPPGVDVVADGFAGAADRHETIDL